MLKTNGKQFGNVSHDFWEDINKYDALPDFVAIAGPYSYYIKFDDGNVLARGLNESCMALWNEESLSSAFGSAQTMLFLKLQRGTITSTIIYQEL